MKIAILGTRGIPNRYGGFERFAEEISKHFAAQGHTVFVTQPSLTWQNHELLSGIFRVELRTPNFFPQNIQTLIYDFRSLCWAKHTSVDVILECGHSFAPSLLFFSKSFRKKIITNPDGIEYHRTKWGFWAKLYLRLSEALAFNLSAALVCDNRALINYYKLKYNRELFHIPYGAYPLEDVPSRDKVNQLVPFDDYYLLVTRLTPENSIEVILNAFEQGTRNCVVVGRIDSNHGLKIVNRYGYLKNVKFLGPIYDQEVLNSLRFYSKGYIHGHSVGGTNPSLLEAMACGCCIVAHDNPFNRDVLGNLGFYFTSTENLLEKILVIEQLDINERKLKAEAVRNRIKMFYSWSSIADQYIKMIKMVTGKY